MIKFNYVITDEIGIHARPAGLLAKTAKTVSSKVVIGVKHGNEITVEVTGEDEIEASAKMEEFFKANL